MPKKEYRNGLLIFLIYVMVFAFIAVSLGASPSAEPLTPLVPFTSQALEIAFFAFLVFPIVTILGTLMMGYLLVPLFLFLHVKIGGEKMKYGFQETNGKGAFTSHFKAFFPALMAINFSLMLLESQQVMKVILHDPEDFALYFPAFVILTTFTIGVSLALFAPIWFLLDGGITYSNIEQSASTKKLVEARSVGGWYYYFLKGYAGIGVLFSYYGFFVHFIEYILDDAAGILAIIVFFVPFPILITIGTIPSILLLHATRNHRKKYVRTIAEKFGIEEEIEIHLETKKKDDLMRS